MKKCNKKEIMDWFNSKLKNNNTSLLTSEITPLGGTLGMMYSEKCHKDASFVNLGIEEVPTFNFPALPKLLYDMVEYSEKNQ
jgi:hypothetical protein